MNKNKIIDKRLMYIMYLVVGNFFFQNFIANSADPRNYFIALERKVAVVNKSVLKDLFPELEKAELALANRRIAYILHRDMCCGIVARNKSSKKCYRFHFICNKMVQDIIQHTLNQEVFFKKNSKKITFSTLQERLDLISNEKRNKYKKMNERIQKKNLFLYRLLSIQE
jgi:hypothetical protein